jgi:hypothetical protein
LHIGACRLAGVQVQGFVLWLAGRYDCILLLQLLLLLLLCSSLAPPGPSVLTLRGLHCNTYQLVAPLPNIGWHSPHVVNACTGCTP